MLIHLVAVNRLGLQDQEHFAPAVAGDMAAGRLHTARSRECGRTGHSPDFSCPELSARSSLKEEFVIVEGSLKAILELLRHDKVISRGMPVLSGSLSPCRAIALLFNRDLSMS